MRARRSIWILSVCLVAGLAPAARAVPYTDLDEVCRKGAGLGRSPLTPAEARVAIGESNDATSSHCPDYVALGRLRSTGAAAPAATDVYVCLCNLIYLRDHPTATAASKQRYARYVGLLDNLLVDAPEAAAPSGCSISATPDFLDVPGDRQRVTVVADVPAGISAVTIDGSRDDRTGARTRTGAASNGRASVEFVYDIGPSEPADPIEYTLRECAKHTGVELRRRRPTVSLTAADDPLVVTPNATARFTLHLRGVGDVDWQLLADGVDAPLSGTSADKDGERTEAIAFTAAAGGRIAVRVTERDHPTQVYTTNEIRLDVRATDHVTDVDDCANADRADTDQDGVSDACDDCPRRVDPEQIDTDGDGIGDPCDVCPATADPNQSDDDQDGIGNACESETGCAPESCCDEYPAACGGACWEACPAGFAADMDCSTCGVTADIAPPTAEIHAPAPGGSVPAGSIVQVTTFFTDAAAHDRGIVAGTFSVSGPAVASGASPASFAIGATPRTTKLFSFTVKSDLSSIVDRDIVVTAQGTDAAGNPSAVASVTVVAGGAGLGLLLSASPTDPGPGDSVTVTITVANCDPSGTQVTYAVAGTDGYTAGATPSVDASCAISFVIPGGDAGVVDVVSAEIVGQGIRRTVSYAF